MSELLPQDYPAFLQSLKERIRQAQTRAALAVSRELMGLYWQIGHDLEAAVRRGAGARRSSSGWPATSSGSSRA